MKTKKFSKKLGLNKFTVSNLAMSDVRGGASTDPVCPPPDKSINPTFCYQCNTETCTEVEFTCGVCSTNMLTC